MDNLTQIPAHKNYVRNECMRRTFWYIFHIETLASAFIDRPLPVLPEQTRVLRLPSEETLFDMPRIEVRPNMDPSYDYLSLPLDQKVCQSEFANLIRVGFIYSGVIAAIGQKARVLRAWEQGRVPISQAPSVNKHETELRTWLELLPDHLRLTEDNLQAYLAQLDGGAGSSAWCFLYMHALAESTVLALHEFADLGSEINSAASLATRQQKALDNLIMILNSMGHRGRTKPIMAILLVTLARHTTPSQQPQVATWFSEYLHMWGVSYEEMMNLQFRVSWYLGRSEPIGTRLFDDLDQQSLYQISGRGSSASTQSLSASEPSSGAVISPGTFGGSAMGLTGITLHPSNCSLFNEESTNLLFKRLVDGSVDNIGPSTTSIGGQPATSMIGVSRHRMPPENYGGIALDPSYLPHLDLSSSLGHSAGPDFIGDRTARDDLPHLFPHGPAGRPRFLSISSHGYGSFGSAESEGGLFNVVHRP
ncbi:hypothetical protein FRC15_006442 [Serendipita sp. 397]|nr:hypothetical protein FRC15_006442 [Serendipita sp. 397]